MEVIRNISVISLTKSKQALHQVGSFLGVTKEDNHLEQWEKKFKDRVEFGNIGLTFNNVIPGGETPADLTLSAIEKVISHVIMEERDIQAELSEFTGSDEDTTYENDSIDLSSIDLGADGAAAYNSKSRPSLKVYSRKSYPECSPGNVDEGLMSDSKLYSKPMPSLSKFGTGWINTDAKNDKLNTNSEHDKTNQSHRLMSPRDSLQLGLNFPSKRRFSGVVYKSNHSLQRPSIDSSKPESMAADLNLNADKVDEIIDMDDICEIRDHMQSAGADDIFEKRNVHEKCKLVTHGTDSPTELTIVDSFHDDMFIDPDDPVEHGSDYNSDPWQKYVSGSFGTGVDKPSKSSTEIESISSETDSDGLSSVGSHRIPVLPDSIVTSNYDMDEQIGLATNASLISERLMLAESDEVPNQVGGGYSGQHSVTFSADIERNEYPDEAVAFKSPRFQLSLGLHSLQSDKSDVDEENLRVSSLPEPVNKPKPRPILKKHISCPAVQKRVTTCERLALEKDLEVQNEENVPSQEDTLSGKPYRETEVGNKDDLAQSNANKGKRYLSGAAALEHYQNFKQIEMIEKQSQLLQHKIKLEQKILTQHRKIEDVVTMTQEHFFDRTGNDDTKWPRLLTELKTQGYVKEDGLSSPDKVHIREQLHQLPTFRPWFTYFITLVQALVFVIVVGIGGVTTVGLEPSLQLKDSVLTFKGRETVEHWHIHNVWIGPDIGFLIKIGALYAPCMREDIDIMMMYAEQNFTDSLIDGLGCCEVGSRDTAGTTTEKECASWTLGVGIWKNVKCSVRANDTFPVSHMIRPCCYGYKGQCKMVSEPHCKFLEGVFFDDGPEHCSEVNCLSNICGMGGLKASKLIPWKPEFTNQWWRVFISIFYHQGLLHLLLVLLTQLVIGTQIEITMGWFRLALIYFISGYASLVAGSIFSPYTTHIGAGGAVTAMIAVICLELVQSWQLTRKPCIEALKLAVLCIFFFVSGTLPFVDNFTQLAGFIYGILTGILFLPYITFGKWHAVRKRMLIIVTVPLLFYFVFTMMYVFYHVQTVTEFCGEVCEYFNCIPYTELMCHLTELW